MYSEEPVEKEKEGGTATTPTEYKEADLVCEQPEAYSNSHEKARRACR